MSLKRLLFFYSYYFQAPLPETSTINIQIENIKNQ